MSIKRLGDIATSKKGKKPSNLSDGSTGTNTVPYVDIKAFEKGVIDKYTDGRNTTLCDDGDLLIVWDGSRSGLVGKAKHGAIGSTLAKITSDHLVADYLYYFLQGKYQDLNTRQRGSGTPHVDPNVLWNFEIYIPEKDIQYKIVAKIEELFSEAENASQLITDSLLHLKSYREKCVERAFIGLKSTKQLGELIESISAGKSFKCTERPPINNEVGVAKVSAVSWGQYKEDESKTCDNPNNVNPAFFINDDDFLMSRANTIELVGAVVIVHRTSKKIMLSDKTLRIKFSNLIDQRYVLYFLRSRLGRRQIEGLSTGNQESMRNISQKSINSIVIPYTTVSDQLRIVECLEKELSEADNLETSLKRVLRDIGSQKQSILSKAFKGELV